MRSTITLAGVLAAVGPAMGQGYGYGGSHTSVTSSTTPYSSTSLTSTTNAVTGGTTTTRKYGGGYNTTTPYIPSTSTQTTTLTTTLTTTSTHTVTVPKSKKHHKPTTASPFTSGGYTAYSSAPTSVQAQSAEGQCTGGSTVTITTKEQVTVTVTAPSKRYDQAAPSHAAPSQAAPEQEAQAAYGYQPHHGHRHHHHHQHSSYTPPTQAPTTTTAAPEETYGSSTASPTSTPTGSTGGSTGGYSGGKRGVAYNVTDMAAPFVGQSGVTWAYNWITSADGLDTSKINYIPTLHDMSTDFTGVWSDNVAEAIKSGSTEAFSFNEPDQVGQAQMTADQACQGYVQYMNPLAGKIRLGAPSVTNGPPPMGLGWLSDFMSSCTDAHIDFVNVHWYAEASYAQDFKDHVTQAHTQSGKPVWVTEFGADGDDASVQAFLEDVMGWMDQQDFVEGYSYFMAYPGKLLSSDTALSPLGDAYINH